MSKDPGVFQYVRDPEADHASMSRAIYKLEIEKLGLENGTLLFPGSTVDIYIEIGESGQKATFRSKIFVNGGMDINGNTMPKLAGLRYFTQNWEIGGSYLDPIETDGNSFA